MLKLGIVGLPNVGKSTLYNALTAQAAPAENYPFCTIDPNVGIVEVPDARLDFLVEKFKPRKRVAAAVEFWDIAGLVEGASKGLGKGNKFLSAIRETDAIVHVIRCFADPNVTHVMNSVDPVRDREIINTELVLADLQSMEKQLDRLKKQSKGNDKEVLAELALAEKIYAALDQGKSARTVPVEPEQQKIFKGFFLISAKPMLYLANVHESDLPEGNNAYVKALREAVEKSGEKAEIVTISSKIESELATLPLEERAAFLADLGLPEPGLNKLIRAGYHLLGLQTYFTAGEDECRAWTIPVGCKAPQAAGVIHTDFERGFIKADTAGFEDFKRLGSLKAMKDQGLLRSEGKEYVVKDGDIMEFKFNV
ncbi:MAG TPA: redox-regulated ATPase YchF [bacterium]|nr:redox-regulated ATPase YchF [bacterium]